MAYIPTMSLDDFAFAYADSPAWVNEPFFRAALDTGVFEMITSSDYKAKTRESKGAKMEEEALPIAKRNLKKIYDAGILVALGTDSGATPIRVQGFAEHVELGLMVQAGLTPLQTISVATRTARYCFAFQTSTAHSRRVRRLTSLCWKKTRHRTSTTQKPSGLFGKTASKSVMGLFEPNQPAKTNRRITL